MKKILTLFTAIIISSGFMMAQDDCMQFFPNNEGDILVNTTYDAANNVQSVMTYRINKVYDYISGENMQIAFVMTDGEGQVIDNGNLEAYCDYGTFYMKMTNNVLTADVINILSSDTELVGDFLDYPNVFNENIFDESPFQMSGGSFMIKSKSNKKDFVNVVVYNRQYVGTEKITTPARTEPFHAAKITFEFEVTRDRKTKRYKGIEWCAMNAGIIRSETYDNNNNLLTKTLLTNMQNIK